MSATWRKWLGVQGNIKRSDLFFSTRGNTYIQGLARIGHILGMDWEIAFPLEHGSTNSVEICHS